jgi:cyclic lactone autoinducer peptide
LKDKLSNHSVGGSAEPSNKFETKVSNHNGGGSAEPSNKYERKGITIMSKIKSTINNVLVKVTYRVAVKGAGLASTYGWHQPKVPEKLTK